MAVGPGNLGTFAVPFATSNHARGGKLVARFGHCQGGRLTRPHFLIFLDRF